MSLTAREEAFCHAYVKKLDKTKAAIDAGYSRKTAGAIGYENLKKPHIIARVAEIRSDIRERMGIDEHTILVELRELSYWSIKDYLDEHNQVKDLSKMPRSKLTPVIGIKTTETRDAEGKPVYISEIKLSDKRAAKVDLARHLGLFERDNLQKEITIKVTRK